MGRADLVLPKLKFTHHDGSEFLQSLPFRRREVCSWTRRHDRQRADVEAIIRPQRGSRIEPDRRGAGDNRLNDIDELKLPMEQCTDSRCAQTASLPGHREQSWAHHCWGEPSVG